MASSPSVDKGHTTHSPPVTPDLVEKILAEGPIGMSAAARRLGTFRDGKATHASTPTRWATVGVRLADGSILKLEAVRLNGRLVTSWQAVLRFVRTQQRQPAPATPATVSVAAGHTGVRTPSARRLASGAAAKRLEDAGL
jgi:hypothetical protein